MTKNTISEKKMERVIDLSGVYAFCPDEEKVGINERFFAKDFEDTIVLPGTTAQAKKGRENTARETGFLTELYPYEGYAWFQRRISLDDIPEGRNVKLFLERTRLTKVWLEDILVGEGDSLNAPHVFDVTNVLDELRDKADDKNEVKLTVMVSNTDYPTKGGHLTSPDTQTNWNGITGRMELQLRDEIYIDNVFIDTTDTENRKARLKVRIVNTAGEPHVKKIFAGVSDPKEPDVFWMETKDELCLVPGEQTVELEVTCEGAKLWSEYTPYLYTLSVNLEGSDDMYYCDTVGFRKISCSGLDMLMNGHKLFLRGKHDGLIFPITGAAPTSVKEWIKVLQTSKEYGINHYRFHTCCPPEAAFEAADKVGMYMSPELPFWGVLAAPGEEGYNEVEQEYLIKEGERMQECFGNHPSFTMLSLGNELWGSPERMNEIMHAYREKDDRHLFTMGSNNFQFRPVIMPEDDYFCGVRFSREKLIRGSYGMCDKPLGHVQTEEPSTRHSYDYAFATNENDDSSNKADKDGYIEIQYGTGVKRVKAEETGGLVPDKPVISHEIGQYTFYPNFDEIGKYTGVLKAINFEVFKERLRDKGLEDRWKEFYDAAGRLAVACYKEELEAAARTEKLSGYQILDLQDFTGQGTALVGILDAFMENKGFITPKAWRGFCSDKVLLAEFDSYILQSGDTLKADIYLRYHDFEHELKNQSIKCYLRDAETGNTYDAAVLDIPDGFYGLIYAGEVELNVPEVKRPEHLILALSLTDTDAANTYELTVYPSIDEAFDEESIRENYGVELVTDAQKAKEMLDRGRKVLFIPTDPEKDVISTIPGTYCSDFWCYPMFRSISESMGREIPIGTMGLSIENDHPALKGFGCHYYSTPDWYAATYDQRLAVLDDITDKSYRPIVQMIDNFERNHKLGLLFEGRYGEGKLMVLMSNVIDKTIRIEVRSLLKSILTYMASDGFAPEEELNIFK